MNFSVADIQSQFVNALRTPASSKPQYRVAGPLPCPYGHQGRIFQSIEQLMDHTKVEHPSELTGLGEEEAKRRIRNKVIQACPQTQDQKATPHIAGLSLDSHEERQTKGQAESEFRARCEKTPTLIEIADLDFLRVGAPKSQKPRSRLHNARLYNSRRRGKGNETSAQSSAEIPKGHASTPKHKETRPFESNRQPGLIELQKYDPRYPGLLLQPDSRPITQEQLASEVKSIYAGLTMVETKCIHVDRAQAAAAPHDAAQKLAPDHWQALIALHRTLLHEHHNFFLASQHPSASSALRRLATKYTMPARMWKHGIHSFLERLRRNLPNSLDYMLAFIYLAYQMMASLYESKAGTAFEDTWLECVGDLGWYRMVTEDEDLRDRETWISLAHAWHSKAADKNPAVGRLYHHLAVLARPNALQQLFYYTKSLGCLEPFSSARQSITTLFDLLIERIPLEPDVSSCRDFLRQLDNYITRRKMTTEGEWIDSLDRMMLFEPPEGDHSPTYNTRSNSQWLSDSLQKVLSRLLQVLKGGLARLHATPVSCKALTFGLLVQKVTATPSTQPSLAGSSTGSQPPSLGPLLVDNTPFDYAMYGIMAIYLAGACLAEPLARRFLGLDAAQRVHHMFKYCSLTLTAAMAFVWVALMGDELAAGIYISVVKIWATTTLHFVVVDCSDAINRTLHIVTFLGLTIVFEFIGMAMQQSAAPSALRALPPSLTVAAVINWAAYIHTNRSPSTGAERLPLTDAEQIIQQPLVNNDDVPGDDPTAIPLAQRPARQQTGWINSGNQMRRRNSIHAAEEFVITDTIGSGSNVMINRVEAASYGQEPGTVHGTDRPDHNARHEDPRFAIGDGFDDVSLHHE